jgi:YidC/Oxa1 family membrane protein insertase
MAIGYWFTLLIYQPFFNILVGFYWMLGQLGQSPPDMGVAVILLTLLIRLLLLPMSLAGDKSEAERRQIAHDIKEIEERLSHDPIEMEKERRAVFARSRGVLVGELFSLAIQIMIALMLWQIFATGLKGKDVHLLYGFMPDIDLPFNLMFLGRFDLTHSSLTLNFIQSCCIFVLETLSIVTSPYPPARGEVVRMQLIMPVVAFLIFMNLPAGKKLFVITTLITSMILTLYKFVRNKFQDYVARQEALAAERAALEASQSEAVVVETK